MKNTDTRTADLSPVDWVVEMTGALGSVAADAGGIGVRPYYLQVSYAHLQEITDDRPWHVSVQVDDVAAADTLADYYGLPADNGRTPNYTRHGVAQLLDQAVGLNVYTGRPKYSTWLGHAEDEGGERRCVLAAGHSEAHTAVAR